MMKTYLKPTIEVVTIEIEAAILTNSLEGQSINSMDKGSVNILPELDY